MRPSCDFTSEQQSEARSSPAVSAGGLAASLLAAALFAGCGGAGPARTVATIPAPVMRELRESAAAASQKCARDEVLRINPRTDLPECRKATLQEAIAVLREDIARCPHGALYDGERFVRCLQH